MNNNKPVKYFSFLFLIIASILLISCGDKIYKDVHSIIKDGDSAIGKTAELSLKYSNDLSGDFETLTKNDDLVILSWSDKYKEQMLKMTHDNNKFYKIKIIIVKLDYGTPVGEIISID